MGLYMTRMMIITKIFTRNYHLSFGT